MDVLTLFGLFAVTAMLIFYALEVHNPWYILAFAAACALGSVYGFLQGAWPFGLVEAVWAGVAVWRWRARMHSRESVAAAKKTMQKFQTDPPPARPTSCLLP
jgi:hypothetical protein